MTRKWFSCYLGNAIMATRVWQQLLHKYSMLPMRAVPTNKGKGPALHDVQIKLKVDDHVEQRLREILSYVDGFVRGVRVAEGEHQCEKRGDASIATKSSGPLLLPPSTSVTTRTPSPYARLRIFPSPISYDMSGDLKKNCGKRGLSRKVKVTKR